MNPLTPKDPYSREFYQPLGKEVLPGEAEEP